MWRRTWVCAGEAAQTAAAALNAAMATAPAQNGRSSDNCSGGDCGSDDYLLKMKMKKISKSWWKDDYEVLSTWCRQTSQTKG